MWSRLRFTSLRLRLVVVFGLVALTAAVSASGIAYWLNREAVLTRAQDAVLRDFQQEMQNRAGALPEDPTQDELQQAAGQMAGSSQRFSVLLVSSDAKGRTVYGNSGALDGFTLQDVPVSLREAVNEKQKVDSANKYAYHLYWQRTVDHDTPYLVAGTRVIGGGPTGYMLTSLEPEAKDLNSLAWSLGIATGLALIGSALLAQAAATTVLKPVHRLGVAARRLGEGRLDTRLRVSGTDELADLSRTFNYAAEALEKRVEDMSARDDASRRFVADMSHELRTPLTAMTAVTEILEEELEAESGSMDPMIEPAVRLVVSETRRLNDLVENLMEVTRFDAGTARLVLDDVDVADQITACIDARVAGRGGAGRRARHARPPRPAPPGRDPGQPDRQRPQARRFPGAGGGARGGRRDRHPGQRPRPRHPRGRPAARLRPLLQGQRLPPALRGQRARPLHRSGERAHPRWRDHRGELPDGGAVFTLRLPRDASELAEQLMEAKKDDGKAKKGQP